MRYRRDIDGLRCLAIVPVVAFHAGIPGFTGGYVGVDVFFVISGFLITSVIRNDIQLGRFTIARFYERRLRRILPALVVTILGSLITGYFLMLPLQYADLASSALAALLFVSNLFFWLQTGYFAPLAEWTPLLNTWSLAVEEQYYIVFPLFMLLARRWRTVAQVAWIGVLALLSFSLSVYAADHHPSAAFYWAPSRAWELLVGVLIAYLRPPMVADRVVRELASSIGLLLVLLPVFVYDTRTPFPGLAASMPCAGTAILLTIGPAGRSTVRSLLELRPIVFVGLISYSLYLWHWPIFAFTRLWLASTELTATAAAGGIILSLLLAVLSWRFVETPFRGAALDRRRIFSYSASSMTIMLALSGAVRAADGMPSRVPEGVRAFEAASTDVDPFRERCRARVGGPDCEFGGTKDAEATFALWGDSHAAAFRPLVAELTKDTGRRGALVWLGGCPPLLGVRKVGSTENDVCESFRRRAIAILTDPSNSIRTILLSARWSAYARGRVEDGGGEFVQYIEDDETIEYSEVENARVFWRGLNRALSALRFAGKEVVLLGGIPGVGWDVPGILALSALHRRERPAVFSRDYIARREALVDEGFRALERSSGVTFVPVWQFLCPSDACRIVADGRPLYSDAHHLSMFGAEHVLAPLLRENVDLAGIRW